MPNFESIAKAGLAGCCSIYLIIFGGTLLFPGVIMISTAYDSTTRNIGIGFFLVAGIVIISGIFLLMYVLQTLKTQSISLTTHRPGAVLQTPVVQPLNTGQSPPRSYPAPPGIAQPPPGSYLVHPGTVQHVPGSYPAPSGTHTYPADLNGGEYPSGYPAAGVTNHPGQSVYRAQAPPQQQQQYYPPQATYEPGNINASYQAPPNYNEVIALQSLQNCQDKIE